MQYFRQEQQVEPNLFLQETKEIQLQAMKWVESALLAMRALLLVTLLRLVGKPRTA